MLLQEIDEFFYLIISERVVTDGLLRRAVLLLRPYASLIFGVGAVATARRGSSAKGPSSGLWFPESAKSSVDVEADAGSAACAWHLFLQCIFIVLDEYGDVESN